MPSTPTGPSCTTCAAPARSGTPSTAWPRRAPTPPRTPLRQPPDPLSTCGNLTADAGETHPARYDRLRPRGRPRPVRRASIHQDSELHAMLKYATLLAGLLLAGPA